jgi:TrmH family RNA methyltransferase
LLDDPKARKVRGVAQLAKKDARSETGLFLLEGVQGLKEVLAHPSLIVELYATEEAVERSADLFDQLADAGISVELATAQVLKAMCDTETPQGVVAVCKQLDVSLESVLASRPRLIAFLSNVRDPGNAGTVLRAADAAGADAVVFSAESVDVYNPKVVRSTTGSLFHLPIVLGVSIESAIAAFKDAGLQVFAANGGGESLPDLSSEVLAAPTVWVMGNEAWGFEDSTLALVDRQVGLPIYGKAESLNLATAASVCLYESAFAQNA